MALMLGQLYDALRAGNVPDEEARAPAEEVANYEGELRSSGWRWPSALLRWMNGLTMWRPTFASSVDARLPIAVVLGILPCSGRSC